ncbi:hypothetical protein Tco_0178797 [Tanacetum coccineum]
MQDMLPGVLSTVLTFLGPTVTNSSSLPIECRTTVNSSVLHSLSGLSISLQAGIGTDIAEIIRKRSKPGKLEHGNGKSAHPRVLLMYCSIVSVIVSLTASPD